MSNQKSQPDKNLKIVFIAPFGLQTKGTVAARMLPIAQVLAGLGHRVRLVVPAWDDPPGSANLSLQKPRHETLNGVEIVFIPVRPGPQPLRIPLRLVRETLNFQPDIIHVFKPKAFSGLAALLLTLRGKPFVLDTDDWEGPGGFNDVNPYSRLQNLLFSWQERDLPRRAAAVTVASRTLQSQVWGFGVKPERVLYLPNGVDQAKYAGWDSPAVSEKALAWRGKLGLTPENLVLLAYTRFAEFKPVRLLDIFQKSLALMSPEQAEGCRLLVVGSGFFGEEKEFQAQANGRGLGDKIIMAGTVPLSDLRAVLGCGKVALYPFDDTLINRARCSAKFLDLLMVGVPVVTEAVGELPNYLKDGEGGVLVRPGDQAAFAQEVVRLAGLSSEERNRQAVRAAERLKTQFSWEKLVTPLESLYAQVKNNSLTGI